MFKTSNAVLHRVKHTDWAMYRRVTEYICCAAARMDIDHITAVKSELPEFWNCCISGLEYLTT